MRRGEAFVVSKTGTEYGPIASRRRAALAARALALATADELDRLLEGRPITAAPRAALASRRESSLRGGSPAAGSGARPSRTSSSACAGSSSCADWSAASSSPPSSRAGRRRSSSAAAGFAPFAHCRRARAQGSRSKPGWRSVKAPASGPPAHSPPNRQKTSCSSTASFAARRRNWPCCRSKREQIWAYLNRRRGHQAA